MRRTIPYAVAVVATVVAVLAVMVGVGLGQPTSSHGGTPSDVFTQRALEPEECSEIGLNADGVDFMDMSVDFDATSDVLVYFSFNLEGLASSEQAQVNPEFDGSGDGYFWLFTGNARGRDQGATVMASFPDQDPGTHTVNVYGAVSDQFGGVNGGALTAAIWSCVLTVFVIPAE